MRRHYILGCLFLALAALAGVTQTYFLLTLAPPPSLRDFAYKFAIRSSVESYGFAIAAFVVGASLLRRRDRVLLWAALAVAVAGLWLFVARELWDHFVVLPRMRQDFLATHSYFWAAPLSALLTRLAWHVLLPITVVFSALLLSRRVAGRTAYQSDEPNADTTPRRLS